MLKSRIVFRADGNSQIGLGHIYRCVAMIQMLVYEFNCLFITNKPDAKIADLIRSYCSLHTIKVQNKDEEIDVLEGILTSGDIVVTDGYDFDPEYQNQIKQRVKKLVMIDDLAQMYFIADVIINHGGTPIIAKYRKEKETKLLIGFDYLLLRKEFLETARKPRTIHKTNTVFICMGGADPFKITIKVLKACLKTRFIEKIIIVTGNEYRDQAELDYLIRNNKGKNILHKCNIDAFMMTRLIYESQIAICPSSTIALEVCCTQAGLISGTVINNQKAIHKQLVEAGCCVSVGDFKKASLKLMIIALKRFNDLNFTRSMMIRQSVKIDRKSGERIVNLFKELSA
ncbi:MAG: UDP-2,4-diacetamido-2,4,6-trideoxy-beta-L-altropyranose hydrolase [Candidatus Margulisbacteria bacterium GWF2_35_9]|nr:MAG: UDP-2,4-diacetamido-2,4,6-trideoxy-beta-L-altropyranose hydrolase [Candidatus Margulisbacteria bacterium GWF2_35_9]